MTANAGDVAYPDLEHQIQVFDDLHARLAGQPWADAERIEIDGTVFKTAAWVTVTRELLYDAGHLQWELPHRNPMPHIILFPRLAHATARARCARHRVRDAIGVLMHGLPEPEEHDAW